MKTKLTLSLLVVFLFTTIAHATFIPSESETSKEKTSSQYKSNLHGFMSLNKKSYEQLTGKKMTLKEKVSLKFAQKMMGKESKKREGGSLPKWAYIVLSIIALGWLAIGIRSNWKTNDWWISLLLYFLFIIPGIIYSLVVMKKYY
jgi:uncharacterized membrane protein YqaE (UPF0057 family)